MLRWILYLIILGVVFVVGFYFYLFYNDGFMVVLLGGVFKGEEVIVEIWEFVLVYLML